MKQTNVIIFFSTISYGGDNIASKLNRKELHTISVCLWAEAYKGMCPRTNYCVHFSF